MTTADVASGTDSQDHALEGPRALAAVTLLLNEADVDFSAREQAANAGHGDEPGDWFTWMARAALSWSLIERDRLSAEIVHQKAVVEHLGAHARAMTRHARATDALLAEQHAIAAAAQDRDALAQALGRARFTEWAVESVDRGDASWIAGARNDLDQAFKTLDSALAAATAAGPRLPLPQQGPHNE